MANNVKNMKTVQTFFGIRPFGANTPVGAPIPVTDAVQILNNLTETKQPCYCMGGPNAFFGYDIVSCRPHATFELIVDMDGNTKMPCKHIGPAAIRELPVSKKMQECIKRASMGKCADEFMRTNVWSVIFPDKYNKQK